MASVPKLLERDAELAALEAAAQSAASGSGSVALVYGEPGIGKTSLINAFQHRMPSDWRLLVGHCDHLTTPRVLGPFRDLRHSVGADLARTLRNIADRDSLYAALIDELDWPGHVSIFLIEDVHWADEGTLDTLRFLVRRISALPVLLVLTYRDEELHAEHPQHHLLADAASLATIHRLPLAPLSTKAVAALTQDSELDPIALHKLTGGNPFFVAELHTSAVTNDLERLPASVVDAVRSRLLMLDGTSRAAVEQLSVVTTPVKRGLLDELVPAGLGALVAAEERGLLTVAPDQIEFRHELTRRAVLDTLPSARLASLNARALSAFESMDDPDPAQLVHHAIAAGDTHAVISHAPEAARAAVAGHSHREAVAFYRRALQHADHYAAEDRAELLEAFAEESYIAGADSDPAYEAQRRAVDIRRSLGDIGKLGTGLRWLSRIAWWCGDRPSTESAAAEAVTVLRGSGHDSELAMALSNAAQAHALGAQVNTAIPLAEQAVALGRSLDDPRVLTHALTTLAVPLCRIDPHRGEQLLEEALELALEAGLTERAARAYTCMVINRLENRDLTRARAWADTGLAYTENTEQFVYWQYISGLLAEISLASAQWNQAARYASRARTASPPVRCLATVALGRHALYTGSFADDFVDQAWELAQRCNELQRLAPAAALACEAAVRSGDQARMRAAAERARSVYRLALELGEDRAELGYWLLEIDSEADVDLGTSEDPFVLQAQGRWEEAALAWEASGHVVAAAAARARHPDPDTALIGLARLDDLGAVGLADEVRRRLRAVGVTGIPRGPTSQTRANVAGLTTRQADVLSLIAEGRTNAEVADALVLSTRTVDHHVAAILDKLGCSSRTDAVRRAVELGWAPTNEM
jgi:DNA-binding CsgD family transcriptional regulator/tetratricopeptide (TPR) repeat protein